MCVCLGRGGGGTFAGRGHFASAFPFQACLQARLVLHPQALGEEASITVPLHFIGGSGDVGIGLSIDALRSQAAVIDSCLDARIPQRLIGDRGPPFAHKEKFIDDGRQTTLTTGRIVEFQSGLGGQTL